MTDAECRQWLLAHPTCYLATLDDEQPRVRCMTLDNAIPGILLFHMAVSKNVYRQVIRHPQVEACFIDFPSGVQIRVRGVMRRDQSESTLKTFLAAHPELKGWLDSHGAEAMGLFLMTNPIADISTRLGRSEISI